MDFAAVKHFSQGGGVMKVSRKFTQAGKDVFEAVTWSKRSSRISNPDGTAVFEMNDAEVPASWSQLATDIVVSKYFRKAGVPQRDAQGNLVKDENGRTVTGPEKSVRQVVHRLAGCWRQWGEQHGYFDTADDAQAFYDEIAYMLLTQMCAPNSPQWFNTGLNFAYGITGPAQGHWITDPTTGETKLAGDAYSHPQPHACFIQSVDDDLVNPGGIMDLWVREARLFKYGSGTGTNFSRVRGENESLSGGGKSSGLMSWLKIGDRAAGAIKSGGTTRRAAKMVCLDLDHPDIEQFVNWKVREELKVAALVEGLKRLPKAQRETAEKLDLKLDYDFNGESYMTVSGQNSNNSVRIPNEFFRRLDSDENWELHNRIDGKVHKSIPAKELWDQIGYAAWRCADPGVQYDTTINEWHTCPASGRINASNPCVTGDTLIATSRGFRQIKDLVGQEVEIVDLNGNLSLVTEVFETGHKQIYKLRTQAGFELRLTADHLVYTTNRGDVPAKELTPVDEVKLFGAGFGESELPREVARNFGALLAQGGHRGGSIFAEDADVRRARHKYCEGNRTDLALREEFFLLDQDTQEEVLRGCFGDNERTLFGVSERLARQLQLVLLSFGIKAELRKSHIEYSTVGASLPSVGVQMYSVKLHATLSELLERLCVGTASRWLDVREQLLEGLTDKVVSVKACGTEDVYDLTEPVTHHFVANGIVVHNCSEYMFLDNTACNLASLNLMKFYDSKTRQFDLEGFEHGTRLWTVVLEISVLMAAFPSREIARLSYEFRTLGLGYANIGAMLMQAGIPYDSETARAICGAFTAILTGRSYATSAEMSGEMGPFPGYFKNREYMLRVIRNHRRAAYGVPRDADHANKHDLGNYEGLQTAPVPIHADYLEHSEPGIGQLANASDVLRRARVAWDDALVLGQKHGYRNAQTTVIAPTGTIGLLMDCDTTGVEPDFALVKFKKLAGGGYFKIANQSLRPALEALGYSDAQVGDILRYVLGALSLDVALPAGKTQDSSNRTFAAALRDKGFTDAELKKITDTLGGAMELSFVFNPYTLGQDAIERLGLSGQTDLLKGLGFSSKQVEVLNEVICGTGTVEGAPHLKAEHLAVFDCANRCGKKGKRFISVEGHIRMMAAAQPFISGAISKTINLPNEASVEDIKRSYRLSWELALKANALYRDGCKLSQVLNSSADAKADEEADDEEGVESGKQEVAAEVATVASLAATAAIEAPAPVERIVEKVVERIVERPLRRRLPDTRRSITHKFNVAGHEGYLTVGQYEDGSPGELFITMAKEGSTIGGVMDSLGTAISVALQYGVPIESLVNKFTHQRFEPAGMTHNPDIPFAKSLVDYIFRWMGIEFIPGYRAANVPVRGKKAEEPAPAAADELSSTVTSARQRINTMIESRKAEDDAAPLRSNGNNGGSIVDPPRRIQTGVQINVETGESRQIRSDAAGVSTETVKFTNVSAVLSKAMKEMQADAPACDVCGTITVRSGTCYKCTNCGNSMGCS